MLYILPAVKRREKTWAVLPQDLDTWRRETDAASNPEGALARKPQEPVLPSRHLGLGPRPGISPVLCPPARARARASRELLAEESRRFLVVSSGQYDNQILCESSLALCAYAGGSP